MSKGICLECGLPLPNPQSFGYHYFCADIAHERSKKLIDEEYPFIIIGGDGQELDRFETESEAIESLEIYRNSEIKNF